MQNKKDEAVQGVKAENTFADLYPLLYASFSPIDGCYERVAETMAILADAYLPGGVRGKAVLDIGCGFGTTAMAISAFAPRTIYAVDNSPGMIELLKTVLLSDIDIPKWVSQKKESKVVLGKYYDATVTRLLAIREAFQKGIFCRRGGNLIPIESDGLYADRIGIGKVDLVIGSNYLHWPVNKLLSKIAGTASNSDALAQACFDALRPLSFLLRPKGIAVFMEGEDFVFFDDMPDEEKDFVGNVAVEHPVFLKFHEILNRILEEEYGIKRLMPVRSKLFPHSEIKTLFALGGFRLKRFHHVENVRYCNPVDEMFVAFPILMGSVDLPFETKLKLGNRVRKELEKSLSQRELRKPLRSQYFFQVLEKV